MNSRHALGAELPAVKRHAALLPSLDVLELKDRLGPPGDAALYGTRPAARAPSWRDQVESGLVNLGWQPRDVDQAIAALEEEGVIGADGEEVNVATVLRAALRKLSKPQR